MKQKIARILIALLLGVQVAMGAGGQAPANGDEAKSRMQDFMKNLDWNHFEKSFSFDFTKWSTCGNSNLGIPGYAACYDEPMLLADYSKKPLKVQSLGISLGSDPSNFGYTRKSKGSYHAFGHVNLVKFPFLGEIIDSRYLCLIGGDITLIYLSAFDPLYDGMFTSQVFKDVDVFFQPYTMLLGVIDCAASSVDNLVDPLGTFGQSNARLRMAFPQYFGCWNAFPMGGWTESSDPIVGAAAAIGFSLASSMRVGTISKSVKIKGVDGSIAPDTMCGPKVSQYAFMKPQFLYNLVYPTASRTVPLGAVASEWAEFKNKATSEDDAAFWVWKRKCMWVGAASCGDN